MIPVLTAEEMREADRRTIEGVGLPGAVLMENAGAGAVEALRSRFGTARRVSVLCGKGNNGGDGYVVARRLGDLEVTVYLAGTRDEVRGDALQHLEALERSGGRVVELPDGAAWERRREQALGADLVVDALLGTGLDRAPRGLVGQVVADLARLGPGGPPVLAVDLPSGLPSDGGEVRWETVRADLTVTFAAPQPGHVLPPACDRVGELRIVDIGIPRSVLEARSRLGLVELADAGRCWPPRREGAHKGDFGHLLVVGGSVGKTGAVVLASTAALRAGAGLVTSAVPAPSLAIVAAGRAEAMTEPLPLDGDGGLAGAALDRLLELAGARDAVALGPGLGQGRGTRDLVRAFVRACPVPLVLDADGLNALAPQDGEEALSELAREAPTVLTPHPGEMARLLRLTTAEVQGARLERARQLAAATGAVVALKGQRTVVAHPDGRAAVNGTGNPGMATGGTGDVLTGLVGALLARGTEALSAAVAAACVHGLAGDLAAERLGQESLLAGDLVEALPEAVRRAQAAAGGRHG